MKALARDTLKYAKMLEEAGVPRKQAEAHIETTNTMMNDYFASKDDLLAVEHRLEAQISSVRNELKTEIASVKNELKTEIASVKSELKQDMLTLKQELTVMMGKLFAWQGGIIIAVIGIAVAILRH